MVRNPNVLAALMCATTFVISHMAANAAPPPAPIIIDPRFEVPVVEPNPCAHLWCFVSADLNGRTVAIVGAALPAAYVHVQDRSGTWNYDAVLMSPHYTGEMPDSSEIETMYGEPIAVRGKDVLVSAIRENPDTQQTRPLVYVFRRNEVGWSVVQTIEPDVPQTTELQIHGMAVDQKTFLISMTVWIDREDRIEQRGIVHAYRKEADGTYRFDGAMSPDDAIEVGFGESVAIDGATAVIGAPRENEETGAVHIFQRTTRGWMRTDKLISERAQPGGRFGLDLDVDGRHLAIGHPGVPISLERPGSVELYVRRGGEWVQTRALENPFTTPDVPEYPHFRNFGQTIELQHRRLLAGGLTTENSNTTMVYLYELHRGSWVPRVRLRGDAPIATRLSGNRVLTVVDELRAGIRAFIYELPH